MALKERKEREKQARRHAIQNAAKVVFTKKGLLESTVDQIAFEAELSKGTIYLYFSSKEEIYVSILEEYLTSLAESFRKSINPALNAAENLRRVATAYFQFCQKNPNFFQLHRLCSLSDIQEKVSTEGMEQRGLESLRLCAEVIKKGVEEGTFSPSIDPWKAAAICWASLDGLVSLFEMDLRKASLFHIQVNELVEMNIDLLIRGFKRSPEGENK